MLQPRRTRVRRPAARKPARTQAVPGVVRAAFAPAPPAASSALPEPRARLARAHRLGHRVAPARVAAGGAPRHHLQRILDIEKGQYADTYYSGEDLPPKLAIPKKAKALETEIVDKLKSWADDGENTWTFANWPAAIKKAHEVVLEEQESGSDEELEIVELDEESEVTSLELPKSTLDLNDVRTLYFSEDGAFANDEGEALSTQQAKMLVQSLKLTHLYDGHGPGLTTETLRSKALTEGVSGKWSTDLDAMRVVAHVYELIASETITPSSGFKVFDLPENTGSVNYRRRVVEGEKVLFQPPASKGKVGFKKQTMGKKNKKTYYSVKTVFPYPQKVDDEGTLLGY